MSVVVVSVAGIIGFICLAGIGANDVANSQAMAVGSGALSLRGAQIIASIFEFLGAALVGQHVSSTVGSKIVDTAQISPQKYTWGMLAAILSTAIWMFTATCIKMPVSSTHSIIGALMGFQLVINNFDFASLNWDILGSIAISWIITPFLSFIMSILFMYILNRWWPLYKLNFDQDISSKELLIVSEELIEIEMDTNESKQQTEIQTEEFESSSSSSSSDADKQNMKSFDISDYFEPITTPQSFKFSIIFGILCSTLILFILAAGPKSINILNKVSWWVFVIIGVMSFIFTVIIGYFTEKCFRRWYINKYYQQNNETTSESSDNNKYKVFVNSDYFTMYLIIASASVAFAHGGNDVANVLGPFAQIFAYQKNGKLNESASIPFWLAAVGGLAIGIGFVLFGKGVLETVGKKIANVTYETGFIAQYSAALTVLICNVLALPVSSSTVIIGSVYGVSFYNTVKEGNMRKKMMVTELNEIKNGNMNETQTKVGCLRKMINRIKKMNIKILLKIVGTWIITIPCNALICGIVYYIIDTIWG